MSRRQFVPLQFPDQPELNRVQAAIAPLLNDLLSAGDTVTMVVDLVPGLNKIAHGLGRTPSVVFAMVHHRTAGEARDDRTTNPHTDRFVFVWLAGATACAATLLVS